MNQIALSLKIQVLVVIAFVGFNFSYLRSVQHMFWQKPASYGAIVQFICQLPCQLSIIFSSISSWDFSEPHPHLTQLGYQISSPL